MVVRKSVTLLVHALAPSACAFALPASTPVGAHALTANV